MWREYGFSDGEKLRATDLSMLSASDLEGPPTNNLATEKDLSQFDREAKVARSRNRRFKAKIIRNNMVLYKTKQQIKIDNEVTKKLSLILGQFEAKWNNMQKEKLKKRLK